MTRNKRKTVGIVPAGRIALIYSDGSINVLKPGTTLESAEKERREADRNERRLADLTKIAEVEITVIKMLVEPAKLIEDNRCNCPHCRGHA